MYSTVDVLSCKPNFELEILTPEQLARFSLRREVDLCRFLAAAKLVTFLAGDPPPNDLLTSCLVASVVI